MGRVGSSVLATVSLTSSMGQSSSSSSVVEMSFSGSVGLVELELVLGYGVCMFSVSMAAAAASWILVSLLVGTIGRRALQEKEEKRFSQAKFFLIALICSFTWYTMPGYLFPTLTNISWICWAFFKSVTAQQIGLGMQGLGLGAMTLDWAAVSSFLFSPLISPFSIMNVFAGYVLIVFIATPIAYWGFDLYNASRFPIFSSQLFTSQGQQYNISAIVNNKFELDLAKYEEQGPIHLSMFFRSLLWLWLCHYCCHPFTCDTLLWKVIRARNSTSKTCDKEQNLASYKGREDIHTKLMRKYKGIPSWWFYLLLVVTITISFVLCTVLNNQVRMPCWGLLQKTPGLNIITEYMMGLIYPGRPIANVSFKVYGYMSMAQAVSFLNDFKLGHYMKIPPRSMFLVQFIGTILAGTINIGVAWWLLNSIQNICQPELLPVNSPWTCPSDRVFFDASVIWGLVGPKRIFGRLGSYEAINWFFLGGAIGPIIVWLLHKAFPKQTWIPLINLPVLLGATGNMPPATALNYNAWVVVGTIFNYFVYRYRKEWWQRYNYVLSGALDAGLAFMGVLLYFSVGMEGKGVNWWGTEGEHCNLAVCPTAKGIVVDGCPLK
ncbi:oligopeptide transporter 4 [Quercus suber]|uniref:Oligopeptide transporter 4 n=1 Tax=Quercus suber TaxID=58331 RepID=A0AAW0JD71_QUESU